MKVVGYLIIIWSVLNLLINISRLIAFRKIKGNLEEEVGAESTSHINSMLFAEQAEYDWGLVIHSLGALLIGGYLALNGATLWQLAGFVLLFLSLGGVIQSFRPIGTERLLAQSGDYETPVNRMAVRLRMISAVELVIGLYLIVK